MVRLDSLNASLKASLAVLVASLSLASVASAAPVILDDFETGEGHFASAPTLSGSNRNVASGTADPSTDMALTGTRSERIEYVANNATPTFNGTMLRFLSGGGTPANNVSIPATGYVGYFLATTTEGLTTGVALDDGTGLERGALREVIADGQFHLYQFNLDDEADFDPFAGTGQNGAIDADTVTLDSIFILGPTGVNPVVYLDAVAHNADGDLSALVPEPSSAAVLGAGMLALSMRRRRRRA
jgi:hypothetical protein